jgi:hypothetical protein
MTFGFGVRIAPELVLTTSHVCFPYSDQFNDADYFDLTVEAWDGNTGSWTNSWACSSVDLIRSVLVYPGNLSTNPGVVRLHYDSKQLVPREFDYALVKTPTNSQPFLDVVGLYTPLNSNARKKRSWELFCTSDFSRRKEPELTHHRVIERNPFPHHEHEMEVKDGAEFKGGNSGSPVVLFADSSPASAFVAGVVVRGEVEPDAKRNFSVLFVQEILTSIPTSELTTFLAPAEHSPCPWPSGRPLLDGFLTGFDSETPMAKRKEIANCFYGISTWEGTGAALDAFDNLIPIINKKSKKLANLALEITQMRYQLQGAEAIQRKNHELRTIKFRGPFGTKWVQIAAPPQVDQRPVMDAKKRLEDTLLKYDFAKAEIQASVARVRDPTGFDETSTENRRLGVDGLLRNLLEPYTSLGAGQVAIEFNDIKATASKY